VVQVCQEHGPVLIVDEAHGSHLGLHPALPRSALQQGAHVVVHSTHKTLGALTQAAMLHVGVDAPASIDAAVRQQLLMLHTSSPSYLLMASLETATRDAERYGFLDEPLAAAELLRAGLDAAWLPCLRIDGDESVHSTASGKAHNRAVVAIDLLRVTCLTRSAAPLGFRVYKRLDSGGCTAEVAQEHCLVFALGVGSRVADAELALACLHEAEGIDEFGRSLRHIALARDAAAAASSRIDDGHGVNATAIAGQREAGAAQRGCDNAAALEVCDMRRVLHAPATAVPWEQAIGGRSAALVSVYPPGIPALVMGQAVTEAAVQKLQQCVARGGFLVGCKPDLSNLRVCTEDLCAASASKGNDSRSLPGDD
jgi:arginine decarboxylase